MHSYYFGILPNVIVLLCRRLLERPPTWLVEMFMPEADAMLARSSAFMLFIMLDIISMVAGSFIRACRSAMSICGICC